MKTPRQLAAEALVQVEARKSWSNLALDSLLSRHPHLDQRDSAFVSALFYGVLERKITLDACVAAHVDRPLKKLDPAVLAVLRVGAYQLLYMDLPESAAVHTAVETAKAMGRAKASGLVNGVLRSFLRGGKAIPLPLEPLAARLSVEYSCPQPLVELWLAGYGEEATRRVLADSLGPAPLYLRANTLRITPEELAVRLESQGVQVRRDPHLPACLAVEGAGDLTRLAEFGEGLFHVQDKSSQLCCMALEARPGMRALDACAAPGGKTFTLAQEMGGEGEILAADLHPHRVKLVEGRAREMGLPGIQTLAGDMSEPREGLGTFDRVLCDAPCSGLGVIRRKPEIKYKNLADFEKLPAVQYKLLETTSQYCKAGGLLLYATCTLNPWENQEVAGRFLENHPEFFPAPLPPPLDGGHQRTLLAELGGDGFYLARFRRGEQMEER